MERKPDMTDWHQKGPFSRLSPVSAPAEVRERVRARVSVIAHRRAALSLGLFYALAAASTGAVVASVASVWQSFVAAGADQFASLAFTDGAAALAYPRELLLSVVESLPILGIAAALAAALALGWSVSRLLARSRARSSAFMYV